MAEETKDKQYNNIEDFQREFLPKASEEQMGTATSQPEELFGSALAVSSLSKFAALLRIGE